MKRLSRSPYLISLWFLGLFAMMVLLALGRLALWFFAAGADFGNAETLLVWRIGLRFDLMVAAYLSTPVLICWFLSLFFPHKIKTFFKAGIVASIAVGCLLILTEIINFGFFCEYRDQFNVWVLGLINDDANAIGETILRDYHWGRYLCAIALAFGIWSFLFPLAAKRVLRSVLRRRPGNKAGIAFILIAVVVAVVFYRGGINRRPPRLRDAAPCDTEIYNRLVLNPVFALKHVLVDLRLVSNNGKAPEFVRDIREQAKLLYGEKVETAPSVEALITTKNERLSPNVPAPNHVYLFVMESYDRWPMLEKYSGIGISETLIALEKSGASSPNFISGTSGTMLSLSSVLSGIPTIDVAQNYRPRGNVALPTAAAEIFKRLGYKTRFAYCGYGMWQRVEDYARKQGFEEIVLGSDVPDCPQKYKGEWGVPDGFLFSHLAKLDEADGDTPTFTLVMSASYHPPYNLPLDEFGCPPVKIPAGLESLCDGHADINTLSHFKYSDRELGKFVKTVSAKRSDVLFAVTGDHFSRRFLNRNPSLAEGHQVPFVIAGPGVPAGTTLPFGTHADMIPTLLALCAPEGFEYPSFGVNLFSEKARERRCTFGNRVILHARGGMLYGQASKTSSQSAYGAAVSETDIARMKAEVDAHRALAWFYFEKGNDLKDASPKP